MKNRKVFYSLNDYDSDGDIIEKGVFLHVGETRIKVAEQISEFSDFVSQIEDIHKEICNT